MKAQKNFVQATCLFLALLILRPIPVWASEGPLEGVTQREVRDFISYVNAEPALLNESVSTLRELYLKNDRLSLQLENSHGSLGDLAHAIDETVSTGEIRALEGFFSTVNPAQLEFELRNNIARTGYAALRATEKSSEPYAVPKALAATGLVLATPLDGPGEAVSLPAGIALLCTAGITVIAISAYEGSKWIHEQCSKLNAPRLSAEASGFVEASFSQFDAFATASEFGIEPTAFQSKLLDGLALSILMMAQRHSSSKDSMPSLTGSGGTSKGPDDPDPDEDPIQTLIREVKKLQSLQKIGNERLNAIGWMVLGGLFTFLLQSC